MKRDPSVGPRLVVHGIGQFGSLVTRIALAKGATIVAAYNRAGAKVGRDLGQVIGLGEDLGVTVRDSSDADLSGIEADVAIVTASDFLDVNFCDYARYMTAGMNVLCHGGESYFPSGANPVWAKKIDTLARANGVTFTGGGIWDYSRIWTGMLAAGPTHELTHLHHRSFSNVGQMIVTPFQALQGGISMSVGEFNRSRADADSSPIRFYKTIPEHVLYGLGYTLTETRVRIEPVTFDVETRISVFEDPIPAGFCVGSRLVAEVFTREGVTATAEIELRLFKAGDIEQMIWSVDGKPRTMIAAERKDTPVASASALFNRIPDVIGAPPGIVPIAKLGPLTSSALRWKTARSST